MTSQTERESDGGSDFRAKQEASHGSECWQLFAHHGCVVAEIERLRKKLAEYDEAYDATMSEVCSDYDGNFTQHCTCVPYLRRGIRERDAKIAFMQERELLLIRRIDALYGLVRGHEERTDKPNQAG